MILKCNLIVGTLQAKTRQKYKPDSSKFQRNPADRNVKAWYSGSAKELIVTAGKELGTLSTL